MSGEFKHAHEQETIQILHEKLEALAMGEGDRGPAGTGWRVLMTSQWKTLTVFVIALGTLIYHIFDPSFIPQSYKASEQGRNATLLRPANLHVLLVASNPDADVCKSMLSATLLGYSTPTIVDLSVYEDQHNKLPKITGVYEFLETLKSSHDDDLVLIVNGHETLFQLRPQTLVDRYFDINRRADKRIAAELGTPAETLNIRQDIVFSGQKRCMPWTASDPACYAVPNSTLPKDLYGSLTDRLSGDKNDAYTNFRQRFLKADSAIGSVRALRTLYKQALPTDAGSIENEQAVLSRIFGEQELWREAARRDATNGTSSSTWRKTQPDKQFFNPKHLDSVRSKAAGHEEGTFDFSIGIDYGSEIIMNTAFAEQDVAWLAFNNRSQLQTAEQRRRLPTKLRLQKLGADIAASLPPFWTYTVEKVPRSTPWADLALLTNVFTANTPAAINVGSESATGSAFSLKNFWPNAWFAKHMRVLFDTQMYSPIGPVAVGGYDRETQRQYWPAEIWRGGVRHAPGNNWIGFNDMCGEFHEDLFMDRRGKWVVPENH